MTPPPWPHPLQFICCCFVCRFSQSCDDRRSPRSPNHRVTSLSYVVDFGNARAIAIWPAQGAVTGVN